MSVLTCFLNSWFGRRLSKIDVIDVRASDYICWHLTTEPLVTFHMTTGFLSDLKAAVDQLFNDIHYNLRCDFLYSGEVAVSHGTYSIKPLQHSICIPNCRTHWGGHREIP